MNDIEPVESFLWRQSQEHGKEDTDEHSKLNKHKGKAFINYSICEICSKVALKEGSDNHKSGEDTDDDNRKL